MKDDHDDFDLISVEGTEPRFGIPIGPIVLRTHGPEQCADEVCCVHNPTDHHMRAWPQVWRADTGVMERTCPCGVGHPDPDDLLVRTTDWAWMHGCPCSHCVPPERRGDGGGDAPREDDQGA